MWFWVALIAFFLVVLLVIKAAARGRRGLHDTSLQQGSDASLQGISSGAGEPVDAADGSGGGFFGGWGGGDGGDWGD